MGAPKKTGPLATETITVRFTPQYLAQIDKYIQSNSDTLTTRSDFARKAFDALLNENESYWDVIFRRLNCTTKALDANTQSITILSEVLLGFITFYFTTYPDFSGDEKEQAQKHGIDMYEKFVKTIQANLSKRGGYLRDITKDLYGEDEETQADSEEE